MKKFLLASVIAVASLTATVSAQAQNYNRHYNYYRGGYNGNWVVPFVGGAIIGGVIANQYYRPVPPPPVYVYPQEPIYVNPPVYGNTTVCRPVQAIDQFGYRYWTQECYQQ